VRRIVSLAIFVVLTFIIIIPHFSSSANAFNVWTIQLISTKAIGEYSIVLDSNNYPHIGYTELVGKESVNLMYSSWNGSAWINQLVAEGGGFCGLALDSQDRAHMVFLKASGVPKGLMYACWSGSSWKIQAIDSNGYGGSIALDSNDRPQIAYFVNPVAALKYASWDGSSWNIITIDEGLVTYQPCLKLDRQNQPHITYIAETPSSGSSLNMEVIKYAKFNNDSISGWNIQTTELASSWKYRNMVLDSNGNPYFSYGMDYASWNGSGWSFNSIDADFNSSAHYDNTYLALDKQGQPHVDISVLFEDQSAIETLEYIQRTGNEWVTQTVVSNVAVQEGPLVIDSNGNPHICYLDISSGGVPPFKIMYATTTEPAQTASPSPTSLYTMPLSTIFLIPFYAIVIIALIAIAYKIRKKKRIVLSKV
jgi:hypothetical protein